MKSILEMKHKFIEVFGGDAQGVRVFTAPGRVNLIGEHTDYNGGYVFPAALTLSSTVVVRPRNDRMLYLMADDLGVMVEASLDALDTYKNLQWGSYQLGVADELQKADYTLIGCELLYFDTVPFGSGLSSSAAIEVVTAIALATVGNEKAGKPQAVDSIHMAKISQLAEHHYIGVKCGIMDQFASAMGKAEHAIFLDCKDLSFRHVPLSIKGYKIVISNTKKKRSLATVKYNERREECEQGLEALKKALPSIQCLGEVTYAQYQQYQHLIEDDTIRKRVAHVVSEDDRVLRSVEALEKGDIALFGKLMIASHVSLRDLYEVTGVELDTLVEAALRLEGVLGSRMTGAGFGGCTVSMVKEEMVDTFIQEVGKEYLKRVGIEAAFYVSEIGDGGRECY